MIKRQQKGFTIVELLIVIVVIGILAAVTLVTYNGIQARAENTKTVNAVGIYAKALQIYKSDNGAYPVNNPVAYVCLPTGGACGSEAALCSGIGGIAGTNTVLNDLRTVLTTLPEGSKLKHNCTDTSGNPGQISGIFYYSTGSTVYFYYILRNNSTTCTPISGLTMAADIINGQARICLGYIL